MSSERNPSRSLALAFILSAALAIGAMALCVTLSGCGQKGPLFLPKQQKTRVPATPSNPTPDAPGTLDTPAPDTQPSDTSPPTSDPTPPA